MKTIVPYRPFAAALERVAGVAFKKHLTAQLTNVLIEARGSTVVLTGNDSATCVKQAIVAQVEKSGAICVNASAFLARINSLPESDVTLETDTQGVRLNIQVAGIEFDLLGMAGDDFPPGLVLESTCKSVVIKQTDFKQALDLTAFAASDDEKRGVLTGVNLVVAEGSLTTAGSDGRRLAQVIIDSDSTGFTGSFLLPKKAVKTLRSALGKSGNVSISFNDRLAAFAIEEGVSDKQPTATGKIDITTRKFEGVYPNYRPVLSKAESGSVTIQREGMSQAASRARLVASAECPATELNIADGRLSFSTVSTQGSAKESLPANGDVSFTGRFNPGFLSDPLEILKNDEVTLGIPSDKKNPLTLRAPGFVYAIMPMAEAKTEGSPSV